MYTCHKCDTEFSKQQEKCPSCDTPQIQSKSINSMVAVHAVTVELEVDNNKSTVEPHLGTLWPLDGEDISFKFIQQVELKFKRKNKFHSYYDNDTQTSVPNYLHKYIASSIGEKDFIELVKALTMELKDAIFDLKVASKVASSKIVFMHYKSTKNDDFGRILAVMVDKKSGFDFTEGSLLPKQAEHVNLEALKQAVSIDVDLFDSCYPEAPDAEAYLRFIRGSSSAAYFRKAFGCEEKSDNGESLDNLFNAIELYTSTYKLDQEFGYQAEEKLLKFVVDLKESSKSSFSIDQAASVIESVLPADRKELENTFVAFVNQNELMINQYIEPTNKQVSDHLWIDFSDQDNGLIARIHSTVEIAMKGQGSDVEYNPSTRRLEIKVKNTRVREKIERMINKAE
ncbi:nucleoid-associated protein [Vibrio vulnificus]|uniref:nucleoid-associated protein n=1 Tax=Vibrio vulnificus TaxID=672 RepID=UPI000DABAFE2|nr:nucleoid-associated protein [Vibrio vulnificus]EGQ9830748.1 nucleoid-associated protein [Vibrio vulnificus]EGR0109237.1 nucleoid-associated protein [Vibrio vulnificus]EGR7951610.1 nucleoid-associated protein [Vibrio vulnificus]EIF5017042.1 nucleoid-associated protein [Vibrio vulnificus]EIO2324832.1 nucleoid-associated protein [Vibrio vulnificus]